MEPRLASHLWVGALIRRAQSKGVYATVLRKGEALSGSIALAFRAADGRTRLLTALPQMDGSRAWLPAAELADDAALSQWLARQAARDPDAWLVEIESSAPEALLDEPLLGNH